MDQFAKTAIFPTQKLVQKLQNLDIIICITKSCFCSISVHVFYGTDYNNYIGYAYHIIYFNFHSPEIHYHDSNKCNDNHCNEDTGYRDNNITSNTSFSNAFSAAIYFLSFV